MKMNRNGGKMSCLASDTEDDLGRGEDEEEPKFPDSDLSEVSKKGSGSEDEGGEKEKEDGAKEDKVRRRRTDL